MQEQSSAFDVNRRGFLALLGATGLTTILPQSVQAALNDIEPVVTEDLSPTMGMWIQTKDAVHHVGLIEYVQIQRAEPEIHFASFTQHVISSRFRNDVNVRVRLAQTDKQFRLFHKTIENNFVESAGSYKVAMRLNYQNFKSHQDDCIEIMFDKVIFTNYEYTWQQVDDDTLWPNFPKEKFENYTKADFVVLDRNNVSVKHI